MTTEVEEASRSHTSTSNKENSNLVSNLIMKSNNKSCVDNVHGLLLETLALLQNAGNSNCKYKYARSMTAADATSRNSTVGDVPSMSIHAVQKLIQCIIEENLEGVHSIIIEASQNEVMLPNEEGEDEEVIANHNLSDLHFMDGDQLPKLLDEDGEIIEEIQHEEDITWRASEEEKSDRMLLGPLNRKSGGTTGVVLELDNVNVDDGLATTPTATASSSFSEEVKAVKCITSHRHNEYLVRILSSTGNFPDTSAHEAVAASGALSLADEDDIKADTSLCHQLSTTDVAEEAVDVGSLPRQGYIMMRYLCEHLLLLQNNDRRPPPPPPSPIASSLSLSLKFSNFHLPDMARLSCRNSSEEGFGYTKWTFTREEIDIIEQEYEWFVSFYSLHDAAKYDDHRSTGISHQSEILSGSNYTNLISTGECNLSDDVDHKLCLSEECQKKENDVPLLDHWIEGISDDGTDEDQDGIEFFRLGVSHVDLLSGGSNDDESEGESSNHHSFRYAGISETKEIYADRSIKPQDSSTFHARKYDDEIFVEFHLPIVYLPYKTGLEPSPKLELSNGDRVAGRYQVAAEIGSAAFSVAYHCIDMQESVGNPNVCLKVIQNSKDFLDQSLDEIKVLQLLQYGRDGSIGHSNPLASSSHVCDLHHILHLRRYFYYKEHLILVTELLEDNLYEFDCKIRRLENFSEYFTLPRLCYITRQVLVALQYVHSLGLIHSDVKPENILMWSHQDAKVKLIDFGSACFTTDQLSSYVQSRSYRAPEVVLGLPYDSKIDLWSLGCVVAELFTGRVLFQNESIVEMLALIESVCGGFPRDMVSNGSKSPVYYLSSGLLCSKHNIEENEAQVELYDIYRPSRSKLEDWLELPPVLDDTVESQFLDFLRKLLTVDPANRLAAEDALAHPWILWGMLLTEDDVKYPVS